LIVLLNHARAFSVCPAFGFDAQRGHSMSYQVGVDLGSTFSAVAVCRSDSPAAELVTYLRTVLFVNRDGSIVVGDEAERRATADPQRVVRQFIRRIGDGVPILAGDTPLPAEVLAARFVTRMLDTVAAHHGRPASRVTVTHPAGWGAHRVAALREALPGTRFLPSPVAAVLAQSTRDRIPPGATVAVYDLGGTGFEASVVRRDTTEAFGLAGPAEDLEIGGLDLDEAVFTHVTTALGPAWDRLDPADPAVRAAVSALRRGCTAAKEALSADTEVHIPVTLPGVDTRVRLTRAEFEEAIRPAVEETVAALSQAITAAAVEPDAILLTGGSARIPLLTQLVSERLGRPVSVASDPKGIAAIGAALEARGPAVAPTRRLLPARPAAPPEPALPVIIPPPPVGPPRADDSGRWFGLPRLAVAGVAATVLAVAVAGGLTLLGHKARPSTSDADTGDSVTTRTVVVTETQTVPPGGARPPQQRPGTRKSEPPGSSSTTRTTSRPAGSTTTAKPPTSTSTTTTSTTAAIQESSR
jgi:actin-like ATPase involved in cell morphogenesis